MDELAFASASELIDKIRRKEISSVELLEHYFARLDRYNPSVNAVILELREDALQEAREADAALARGESLGPLHGLPMTVKEAFSLVGTPSTWGLELWADLRPEHDATVVRRLREAGALIFGKSNVPFLLSDWQSYNDIYGTTNNPWDLGRSPGGSSGGSAAALAAGLSALEYGSDIGGSIRNPAHFCGVFGHKPSFQVVPQAGHGTPGSRLTPDIAVCGPLARSAQDLELALRLTAGPDGRAQRAYQLKLPECSAESLADFRVAVWAEDESIPAEQEIAERVRLVAQAFRDAGAQVDAETRPKFPVQDYLRNYMQLLSSTLNAIGPEPMYALAQANAKLLAADDRSLGASFTRAALASHRDWFHFCEQREALRQSLELFFEDYDLLLCPVVNVAAFPHDHRPMDERRMLIEGESYPYMSGMFWAGLASHCYLPATVIPTGLNHAGLPIGVQIVSREYGDLATLRAAQLLEKEGFCFQAPQAYQ